MVDDTLLPGNQAGCAGRANYFQFRRCQRVLAYKQMVRSLWGCGTKRQRSGPIEEKRYALTRMANEKIRVLVLESGKSHNHCGLVRAKASGLCAARREEVVSGKADNAHQPYGGAGEMVKRVLVLDGTNLHYRSQSKTIDVAPDGANIKHLDVFEAWIDFLIYLSGAEFVVCVFDHPSNNTNHPNKLKPDSKMKRSQRRKGGRSNAASAIKKLEAYRQLIESKGGAVVISRKGHEADDAIGRTIHVIRTDICTDKKVCPDSLHFYVASSDSDMQQYIDEDISWLHILPGPTDACPNGCEIISLDTFQWIESFHPRFYTEFLCLVGRTNTNIGGLGIGSKTAAKLLKSFGNLDAVQESSKKGLLKGWDKKVQRIFDGSDRKSAEKLERNKRWLLKSRCTQIELDEDSEGYIRRRLAGLRHLLSSGKSCKDFRSEISIEPLQNGSAWRHPMHAIRWKHVQNCVERAARDVREHYQCLVEVKATNEHGVPVDILVKCMHLCIVMIPSESKVSSESQGILLHLMSEHKEEETKVVDPYHLTKHMSSQMHRYLKQLSSTPVSVIILPCQKGEEDTLL